MVEQRSADPMRDKFERHVYRSWHKSYRNNLGRNGTGGYVDFDMQMAWLHWRSGYIAGRRNRG